MKKTINSIEQLKKVFFLVLGLVAFINGLNYYISQEYLVSEKKIHASINLSTKQRMLSQEILATAFIYAMIPSEREATKKTLKQLTRELERNNKTLINGSSELIGAMKLDRSFYSMYFENPVNINYKTKRTVYMVYDLLEDNADLITFENEHVYLLKEYSPILLQALQKAIDKFQEVGAEAANARDIIRLINMSVTLLALVFLAYYVLFPVVKRVKTREYQLSAQHDLLDLIIDSTTNALVVMNDHSEVLIFNKAAQKMFGYSSSQMVGSDTLHYIIPKEYQAKHQKGSTHFFKTGESSGLINNTTLVKGNRSNGEIFDIEIGFGAGVLGGKRIVVANMVVDVMNIAAALFISFLAAIRSGGFQLRSPTFFGHPFLDIGKQPCLPIGGKLDRPCQFAGPDKSPCLGAADTHHLKSFTRWNKAISWLYCGTCLHQGISIAVSMMCK